MKYIAYTDGSYIEKNGKKAYGSAAIFRREDSTSWSALTNIGHDEKYMSSRNVAGEVLAVLQLCNHMIKVQDCDSLEINYDYTGIENWVTGAWKAKIELTQVYRDFMRNVVMKRLRVTFNHTKGHTGIEGNETVDRIVNKLVQDYVK